MWLKGTAHYEHINCQAYTGFALQEDSVTGRRWAFATPFPLHN